MTTKHETLSFRTSGEFQFLDITDDALKLVARSGIKNGLLNVQTLHTTAAIIVNENEPLLLDDFRKHLEELCSKEKDYKHDDFSVRTVNMCDGECANGHAHCKAAHLAANATLNVLHGKLQLGTWQRVLFVELDRARERKVQLLILGE